MIEEYLYSTELLQIRRLVRLTAFKRTWFSNINADSRKSLASDA